MKSFPDQIRELRKQKGDTLRVVAAYLNIDQGILSKIERGQRRASRTQVIRLAAFYSVNVADLIKAWLSDIIVYKIENEELALEVLKLAEEKVLYKSFQKTNRKLVIKKIKDYLNLSGKIQKAWIYGSFARGGDGPSGDIDIAVQTDDDFSYFDLAEIQYHFEKALKRKIDIGFVDSFKPHIFENLRQDLKLVYERQG
jgi:predicted nucleotidyltransferase